MTDEGLRAFIAVGVSDALRQRLAAEQQRLRSSLPGASWTRPEGIHLTLHFLGDISPHLAERLGVELARACAPCSPFELVVRGLGVFPSPRRPRVIWVGVEGRDDLHALHAACASVLHRRKLGAQRRRYHPHLTLARFRRPLRKSAVAGLLEALDDPPAEMGRVPVREVCLYRSELRTDGALHTVIARAPLVG